MPIEHDFRQDKRKDHGFHDCEVAVQRVVEIPEDNENREFAVRQAERGLAQRATEGRITMTEWLELSGLLHTPPPSERRAA